MKDGVSLDKEYIEREALLEEIKVKANTLHKFRSLYTDQSARAFDGLAEYIAKIPAADVTPVIHGEWIEIPFKPEHEWDTVKGYPTYKCSLCGRKEFKKEPYCHCGARMDGGKSTTKIYPRCHKCIHETVCSKDKDNDHACPDYRRDAPDGGFYG